MKLDSREMRAVITVSLILASRLLGIFLILPVFSIYAEKYPGSDLALAGVAFGIYALVQSVLQIPYGWASDRFGRKPVLLVGIVLFTAGSVLCGMADTINELIIARILQGSGAITSVAIASLGDVTRPGVRAQSFTVVGISVGVSFLIAIVLGPYLAGSIGFSSLFYILAVLGALSILITLVFFPEIQKETAKADRPGIMKLMAGVEMRKLLVSALILAMSVNLFVFIYPLTWTALGVSEAALWKVYLIALLPAAVLAYPYVRHAEKRGNLGITTRAGWVFIALAFLVYPLGAQAAWIMYGVGIVYFAGHTIMQSLLPAFLTQRVGQEQRGATTGIYNLMSFFGSAVGGMTAGYFYQLNPNLPVIAALFFVILWGIFALPNPPGAKSRE